MVNLENTGRILIEALDRATRWLGTLFRHEPHEPAQVYVGRHRLNDNPLQVVAQW